MSSLRMRPRTLSRTGGDPVLEAYYEENLERLSSLLAASPGYYTGTVPQLRGAPMCILASREDRTDVLQLLYKLGGDGLTHLAHKDASGKNCLHTAIRAKALSATDYLLSVGFDSNEPDDDDQRPLHAACVVESPQLVAALLAAGADCNLPDHVGNLPLHQACQDDQESVVRLLVDRTADVDARGANGRTALHYAALAQSLPLMKLLMERGASVRKYDDDRHTPMDIVLTMGNQNTLAGLADYFASMVPEDCANIDALVQSDNFNRVLNILDAIDDDLENPVESPVLTFGQVGATQLSEEEKQHAVDRLASNDRIDFMEFRRLIHQIAANNLSPMLIQAECTLQLAQLVSKLVLFREDVELLTTIMFATTLWPKLQLLLEESIETMYENCAEIGSTGMVALMHRTFFDKERHTWREDMMLKFFHNRLKMPMLEPHEDQNRRFLRNPARSLSVWSVMSGRFHLTEELVKGEQFDILPIGLFCVALLRKLQALSGIPRPTKKTMEQVADRVESICMSMVRSVNTIDTSEKKMVAINFIRQRLPVYGDLTCMGLASQGQSDSFMVMQAVQGGVDREWFKRLYHTGALYRELLILLGLLPFNPLLFVFLRRLWIATCHLEGCFPGETGSMDRVEVVAIDDDEAIDDPEEEQGGGAEKETKPTKEPAQEKRQTPEVMKKLMNESILHEAGRPSSGNPVGDFIGLYVRTMFGFYFTPSVKFHYHILAHIIFIGIFSYLVVVRFEYQISLAEILVYLFLLGFFLEELHELNHARLNGSMLNYITDGWNILDTLGLLLSFIGFCMRMPMLKHASTDSYTYVFTDMYYWWTRFVLQMACLVYWMRLLYVSTVMETLGPKLKMISVMITKDFVPFLIMLAIIMFGFGVMIHGLLFPNGYYMGNPAQRPAGEIFQSLFKITFYAMVGEYSMDTVSGKDCSDSSTCPHPLGQILIPNVVMCIYIIIVSVLLLNLIVASFSKTVDEIDKKSVAMWQFERYDLLEEFMVRSPLPPPLSILGEIARWLVTAWEALRHTEIVLRRRTFSKHRIIYYLTLQAFSMRGQRAKLVGEVEVEDPERLIPQMARKVKRLQARLSNVRSKLLEPEEEADVE